ncbi:MAG: aminopeptidase, partial [Rectinema subterraneum]|uniref:aminopeptidase n=1 Tax=Rectinema subterraneum TaxID=2653714 RepID=UPI003C7B4AD7
MNYDRDMRWVELGKILVDYSTNVSKGDRVLIIMREPATFPLAREIYRHSIFRGAFPQTLFTSVLFERDKLIEGSEEQAAWVPELFYKGMEWADVCFDLRGATNLFEFSGIDTTHVAAHRKAEGIISALRTSKTRWVIVRLPSPTLAQTAGLSLDSVMDIFFSACFIDWQAEEKKLQVMAEHLNHGKNVVLITKNTELRFSIEGRKFMADSGHINMPGGEIYTSPVEDSIEGHISFENPGVFAGFLMDNISLTFSKGKVVDAHA